MEHTGQERKKLQELARKHYHTKLIRGFAHELNNYMTGILGFSQLILEVYDLEESMKEELKEIESSAIRSRDAIKQISRLWRTFDEEAASVHFQSLFRDIHCACKYYTDKKGLVLSCEPGEGDVYINAQEEDLEDAFYSLLLATIGETSDNNVIRFTPSRQGDMVALEYEVPGAPGLITLLGTAGEEEHDRFIRENTYLWVFFNLIKELKGKITAGSSRNSIIIYLPAGE